VKVDEQRMQNATLHFASPYASRNSFRQNVNPEEYTDRRRRRGCRLRGRISERPEVAIRDLWVQVSIKCDDFADTSPPVERLRSRKNYISV